MEQHAELTNMPRIGHQENYAFPTSQVNLARPVTWNKRNSDGLVDLGAFGVTEGHWDNLDDAGALTCMIALSLLSKGCQPGRFNLLGLGFYAITYLLRIFAFSGLRKHGGSPPILPAEMQLLDSYYRLMLILYPPASISQTEAGKRLPWPAYIQKEAFSWEVDGKRVHPGPWNMAPTGYTESPTEEEHDLYVVKGDREAIDRRAAALNNWVQHVLRHIKFIPAEAHKTFEELYSSPKKSLPRSPMVNDQLPMWNLMLHARKVLDLFELISACRIGCCWYAWDGEQIANGLLTMTSAIDLNATRPTRTTRHVDPVYTRQHRMQNLLGVKCKTHGSSIVPLNSSQPLITSRLSAMARYNLACAVFGGVVLERRSDNRNLKMKRVDADSSGDDYIPSPHSYNERYSVDAPTNPDVSIDIAKLAWLSGTTIASCVLDQHLDVMMACDAEEIIHDAYDSDSMRACGPQFCSSG
ncbi:hypothetical protein Hypma_005591 [Hypsizygus marmoreus]|uniref:Uncharacterized protein n=1 Tax=Hypsizygus marmoreus TaxID=39966 RepID=A0A369K1G7_HYPMA|nr:hypothetical protein Hypma_005591 [Hypsizygus marmoreus]